MSKCSLQMSLGRKIHRMLKVSGSGDSLEFIKTILEHVNVVEKAFNTFSSNSDNEGLTTMLQGEFNAIKATYLQLNDILIE